MTTNHQWSDRAEHWMQGEMTSNYDVISVQMGRISEGSVVLNVGVGPGIFASYVTRVWNAFVIGVDTSKRFLESAKKRAEEAGVQRRVFLLLASADHLPLRGRRIDAAASMFTLYGLAQEKIFEVFREVGRVLAKNGTYVLVEDWAFEPKSKVEFALLELRRILDKKEGSGKYCLNYREYAKVLRQAGFEIEEIRFLPRKVSMEIFNILREEVVEELLQIVSEEGSTPPQTNLILISSKVKR